MFSDIKRLIFPLIVALFASAVNVSAAGDKPAGAKVAEPRQYTPVTADRLGVNENGKGLAVGTEIKSFTLNDMHGKPFAINKAWRDKPALVVFYRGGWCPYCNMQIRELAVNYDKLAAAGVQPVLISVDGPDKAAMVSATYEVPFPVLSDPDLTVHRAFNVVLTLDAATIEKYKGYGLSLQQWSGKNHNSYAVASVFLIDQQGRVLVSHAPEDYRTRPSIEQLLALINDNSANR